MIGEQIYDVVENLVEMYETRDPFKLCRDLDMIVLFVPLVRVNGFYQRYEGQDIIYINESLSDEEKILVCAHELGHAILHNDINTISLTTHISVESKYELEANAFAIQLLQEDLNLRSELPLVDWRPDNNALLRRVNFQFSFL